MKTKRKIILGADSFVQAGIALAAATGDRLKIPVLLGQGQAVLEQLIFDQGAGSSNPSVQATSAGAVQLSTNGSVRETILSNGNVGIGTSSPSNVFHVFSGNGNVIQMERSGLGAWFHGITTRLTGDSQDYVLIPETNGSGFSIESLTDGGVITEAVTANKNGLVGINNLDPQGQLHVKSTGGTLLLLERTSGVAGIWTEAISTRVTGDNQDFVLIPATNTSGFSLETKTSGGVLVDAITANSAGQVGIDNVNPTVSLDVTGAIKSSSDVTVGGFVTVNGTGGNTPHACTIRSHFCSGVYICDQTCNAGEIVTGGGCDSFGHVVGVWLSSYPSAANIWHCERDSSGATGESAYAVCCSI